MEGHLDFQDHAKPLMAIWPKVPQASRSYKAQGRPREGHLDFQDHSKPLMAIRPVGRPGEAKERAQRSEVAQRRAQGHNAVWPLMATKASKVGKTLREHETLETHEVQGGPGHTKRLKGLRNHLSSLCPRTGNDRVVTCWLCRRRRGNDSVFTCNNRL